MSDGQPLLPNPSLPDDAEALTTHIHELDARVQGLEARLPNTWLLSDNLLKRAFGVYGHYLLAVLIIVIPIFACSFFMVFVLGLLAAIIGSAYSY